MLKKIITIGIIIFFVQNTSAQNTWPVVTNAAKPWTRWWWMGSAVDETGLSTQLKEMAVVGFGGVEVVPIYGAKGYEDKYIKYLSPRWMQMLDYTTRQASLLIMGVDISVGTGWPIGGPQVTIADAASKLSAQNYIVEAGGTFNEKIEVKDARQKDVPGVFLTALVAYDNKGRALDITDRVGRDGRVNWQADSGGRWEVLAAFTAKTRQAVKRAAFGGEGFTLDHFSAVSLQNYFKTFDTAFGNSSHGVRSFFNDSYEVYNADWTPGFFNEFKKRRQYDLKPFLRELVSKDNGGRVKSDYRQTMSELMLENFTQNFTKWAHSKKALNTNQAHGSPGNLLDLYAAVDIPQCETFGSSSFAINGIRRDSADVRNVDPDPVMLKFASSAAHAKGKLLTSCETFTWLTEHFKTSWSQCKPEVEQVFLAGINHVFYHGTTYSPANMPFPGWLFYASVNFVPNNSLWPHLKGMNEYITRCQSVLQAGNPDNEIKAYWPVFDAWNNPLGLDMPFKIHDIDVWLHPTPFYRNVVNLQQKGFSMDFVSDKMLKDNLEKNMLTKRSRFYVYLVSQCNLMPASTLKNIIHLAKEGDIVVMQALPNDVPGFGRLDEERAELKKLIASIVLQKINDDISVFTTGKGKIIVSKNVQMGLEFAQQKRETLTDLGLKFIRRKVADGKYYYLVNHTAVAIDTTIRLEIGSASVTILDPQTGAIGLAGSSSVNNRTLVKINLQPGEALILKTSTGKQSVAPWKYLQPTGKKVLLNSEWNVHFTSGGPIIPADRKISGPQNWTTFPDTATQSYSGTAMYSTTFNLSGKRAAGYELALGQVNESAKVVINGKYAGILWCMPFKMDIGRYLRQGENSISIEVANLMANRIRYMDRHKMEWRKYHEINFVNINYKDFDASGWKVQPSGLEGPVTITEMK